MDTPPTADPVNGAPYIPRALSTLPAVAARDAQKRLKTAAKKQLGMGETGATTFSHVWVDPDDMVAQLHRPRKMRIPGGTLRAVEGEAWVTAVCADLDNPRIGSTIAYPLALHAAGEQVPKRASAPVTASESEVEVTCASLEDLIGQVSTAMTLTRKANDLNPPVADQGIMDPPIAVMTRVSFADGAKSMSIALVREGTSRVSHAQHVLGVTARQVLQRFPASSSPLTNLLHDLNSLVSKPVSDLTSGEMARIRCMVIPLVMIVGFDSDADSGEDLAAAVEVKIGQEHINTKQPWSNPARWGKLGTACLRAAMIARIRQVDNEPKRAWLSGELARPDAKAAGIKVLDDDDRFARLVYLFGTQQPTVHRAIRQTIALAVEKPGGGAAKRIGRNTKIPLAVELALRGVRLGEAEGGLNPRTLEQISSVLTDGADRQLSDWAPSTKPIKQLEADALSKLEAGSSGHAGLELSIRGLYYLALYDAIRGPRNDEGTGGDRRSVAEILDTMTMSERGIKILAQAIIDGREGRAPTMLDEAGNTVKAGHGGPAVITRDWLRKTAFPKGVGLPSPDPLQAAIDNVSKAVLDVRDRLEDLRGVGTDGSSDVEVHGVETTQAATCIEVLRDAADSMARWQVAYLQDQIRKPTEAHAAQEPMPPNGSG